MQKNVKINFYGIFKIKFGKKQIYLPFIEGQKLKDIIYKLIEISPDSQYLLIDPELILHTPNVIILINGNEIGILNSYETKLKPNDEITLIPRLHT